MGNPRPCFRIFGLFQTNINTIFTTNQCEKCPSSLGCWNLNPRPSDWESHPITTIPGLPPILSINSYYMLSTLNFCCCLGHRKMSFYFSKLNLSRFSIVKSDLYVKCATTTASRLPISCRKH